MTAPAADKGSMTRNRLSLMLGLVLVLALTALVVVVGPMVRSTHEPERSDWNVSHLGALCRAGSDDACTQYAHEVAR